MDKTSFYSKIFRYITAVAEINAFVHLFFPLQKKVMSPEAVFTVPFLMTLLCLVFVFSRGRALDSYSVNLFTCFSKE